MNNFLREQVNNPELISFGYERGSNSLQNDPLLNIVTLSSNLLFQSDL